MRLGCLFPELERYEQGNLERRQLDELVIGAGEAPEELNRPVTATDTDQGPTDACPGHGWAHGLEQRGRFLYGPGFPFPAPRAIYTMARFFEGEPYLDNGTTMGAAGEAVSTLGFPPNEVCPWDPAFVDEPLDLDVLRASFVQVDVRWHRIFDTDRKTVIKRLLNSGVPIVIGQRVGRAYLDYTGGLYRFPDWDRELGGHCTSSEFRYDAEGVWFVGSYGTTYGVQGRIKVAWSEIEDPKKVPSIVAIDMVRRCG